MTVFVTKLALIGGARHVYYLTKEEIPNAAKWSWISQPWGVFLFAPGKAAVAFLILRIMGPNTFWRKWFLAAMFSGIKIRYIIDLSSRGDFTWGAYNLQAWTGAEAFIMIVCGNIPPLQPLWDRFVTHKLDSNYGHTPINNYKMSHPTYGSRSKQSSIQSTNITANNNTTNHQRQYGKGINATTDIRITESIHESV
ncbi:hypothetical protein LAWI1_G008055 [Lachnellula willkommii]|uniref:Satratoxin biosynthesis SC1 cluster protein n=1 Tax=Lachnellula willkommii TaxID=215461 RepID=A0A559M5Z2_9HELO|nr:hypothetical protein LAWI1_G008055 [Lachnellula willkommii]